MNEFAITVGIILLPGFVAILIVENFLNYSPKWSAFKFIIHAFILGVASYISLQMLIWVIGLFPHKITFLPSLTGQLDIWSFASERQGQIDLSEVFAALIFSPFIGILTTRIVNDRNWKRMKALTKSKKYGNENLFSYFLSAETLGSVYVRDYENDIMYEGMVVSYSENDQIQEIVLENVRVFRNHDSEFLESLPQIYISKPAGAFVIENVKDVPME